MPELSVLGTVVAAVSFDDTYAEVVRASSDVARQLGTSVLPVHGLRALGGRTLEQTRADNEEARKQLLSWYGPEIGSGLTVLEPIVELVEPSTLVSRTADEVGARLVVTAGGQRSTLRRWMIGSVAERIVRRTMAPVWVARGTAPGEVKLIVCGLDLTPSSETVLDEAIVMARAFGSPLRVVTVVEHEHALFVGGKALRHFDEKAEKARRAELDELFAHRDARGLRVEIDVGAGNAAAQILEAAHDADLVVVGKSSHGHVGALGLGGTAEKVVRGAWCSVLAVRTPVSRPA